MCAIPLCLRRLLRLSSKIIKVMAIEFLDFISTMVNAPLKRITPVTVCLLSYFVVVESAEFNHLAATQISEDRAATGSSAVSCIFFSSVSLGLIENQAFYFDFHRKGRFR